MPLTNPLIERAHPLNFLLSEGPGHISRDNITILQGEGVLAAGTVIGLIATGTTNHVGKYRSADPTSNDGSQAGVAILAYPVDATLADVETVAITRYAEVNGNQLVYDQYAVPATQMKQLAAAGIIVRF